MKTPHLHRRQVSVGNAQRATCVVAKSPADSERPLFLQDVADGLVNQPKFLHCKYLYDQAGSQLFDQICELDDYYPTRVELSIMRRHSAEMGGCLGPQATIIELGSGSSIKTRLLLSNLRDPEAYLPVDISEEHLLATARGLDEEYPELDVHPLVADFTKPFEVPGRYLHQSTSVYFPGSTIGNLETLDAISVLSNIAKICGEKGGLLIGFDLVKDVAILEKAYNDDEGVTAEFNLNLLQRINRELEGDFDVEKFAHVAFFNRQASRIEIYIESLEQQQARVGDQVFSFEQGERILTEYSHKYTIDAFANMANLSGLVTDKVWMDADEYFAVALLKVPS